MNNIQELFATIDLTNRGFVTLEDLKNNDFPDEVTNYCSCKI